MNDFKKYLDKNHSKSTSARYLHDVKIYIDKNPDAKNAVYQEVIDYVNLLRKQYSNKATVNRILQAIKKYYHYLVVSGHRSDNPAKNIYLKNYNKNCIMLHGLFTTQELELLLDENLWPRKTVSVRNKLIMSLLIYQALTRQELENIKTRHIDLEKATIKIPGTTKTNARELPLKPSQIMLAYKYINEIRTKLISKNKQTTDILLLDWHGKPISSDAIRNLTGNCKKLFPGKNLNVKTIRLSVIANLLKSGNDLRTVQAFAGHKYPSSTERYKQNQVEELKVAIDKFFPVGENKISQKT